MKSNTKRIVAREFLVTIGCLIISVISYFSTFIYNYTIDSKRVTILNEIENKNELVDSLRKPFKVKLDNRLLIYGAAKEKEGNVHYDNPGIFWSRLTQLSKNDSIVFKWDNVWPQDFKNTLIKMEIVDAKAFNKFILENNLSDNDIEQLKKASNIMQDIAVLKSKAENITLKTLKHDEHLKFALFILLIIGVISFPIRYLIYSIKWSIKVMQNKDNG